VFSETCGLKRPLSSDSKEVLIVGNPWMDGKFWQLPSAEREAREIAQLFDAKPIIGRKATCSRVASLMPDCRIIHLATHGSLAEKQSEAAYIPGALVLSDDDGMYAIS